MKDDYDVVAIDDDEIEHHIMSRALRNTAHSLICFLHADEALSFLSTHQPKHLFVDYRMPEGDGITFLKRLAAEVNLEGVKIYLTSGSQVPHDVEVQAHELGAQFIVKDEMSEKGFLENLLADPFDADIKQSVI